MRQSPESYERDPRMGVLPDLFTRAAIMRLPLGPSPEAPRPVTQKSVEAAY
jgi:hypothetical protein